MSAYRSRLGLTVEQYDALLAAQGGHSGICPNTPKTRRLHADHDHKTGAVRGLLCHRCNRRLDTTVSVQWLYDAAAYLALPPTELVELTA